jgi:hypothetical protein
VDVSPQNLIPYVLGGVSFPAAQAKSLEQLDEQQRHQKIDRAASMEQSLPLELFMGLLESRRSERRELVTYQSRAACRRNTPRTSSLPVARATVAQSGWPYCPKIVFLQQVTVEVIVSKVLAQRVFVYNEGGYV